MKLKLSAIVLIATFASSTLTYACQATVMGGCVQEPTHDTSSHMKSQIVNKVEAPKQTVQVSNVNKTKLGSKKSSNSASLVETATKAVIK